MLPKPRRPRHPGPAIPRARRDADGTRCASTRVGPKGPLPRSGHERGSRSCFAVAAGAALLALGLAVPAVALDLDFDPPRVAHGYLWVDAQLYDVFARRVEESLGRGMPATLQLHTELWRKRSGWFDRLSGSFDASIRIRYDVWLRTYRLERPGVPPIFASTLDSVRLVLANPIALPLARLQGLPREARYYAVVSAVLKPLTVEDVEEGEGWLSGEVVRRGGSGVGIVTAIPRSIFDAVRNFAGLGDQRARAISEEFALEGLAGE